MEPEDADAWDFFVSYTQADRAWAEWIAWQLEQDHQRVLIQAWDFVPGTNWIQSMHEGASRAERTIAVLSDAYLRSVYGGAEWQAAWAADPTGAERKLLVVRVGQCERPGLLAGVVSVDLHGETETQARLRLRRLITQAKAGRAKPENAPPYPARDRAVTRSAQYPGALPAIWDVPARNPNFTGRGDDLRTLLDGLASRKTVTVHALQGLGGVGKTQLAIEYAHVQASHYDVVWWINAEEPTLIAAQMARLARGLGVEPRSGDDDGIRDAVQVALTGAGGWLLVFDNAEEVSAIRMWLPATLPNPGAPGHALITTRREGFDALGAVVNLDVLEINEAITLLRKRAPVLDDQTARSIAEALDRLPLALEQAAAYITKTKLPGGQYLELLKTREDRILSRGTVAGRDVTVATLWDLSLEKLTAQEPAAVQLLGICAYLAPVPIPEDLFTSHPELLPEPLGPACRDPLDFNDVIGALVDYSLVKRTVKGLLMHRLVQAAIRSHHAHAGA